MKNVQRIISGILVWVLICSFSPTRTVALVNEITGGTAETINAESVEEINSEVLPAGMEEITFCDFGIEDGSYSNTFNGSYAGTTMDKTLFSGKLTFSTTGETHFMYGGTKSWGGFILTDVLDPATNEYYLRLYDSNADKDNGGTKKFNDVKFYADKAGVDTFVGKEIELNYTIEYVNNDNGTSKNDLKLGVWFNKTLYDNQYIYINDYVDNGHSIGNTMTVWNRNGATIGIKSCNYQLPKNMTEISFRDFGIADGEYTKWKGQTYAGDTMNNTLFGGTITFPEVVGAQLSYAGKENYTGLELVVAQDSTTNEWYLRLRESKNQAFKEIKLCSTVAGVELVGAPLDLNISIEYVNIDEGNTHNDVKLGIWFDGNLYNDEYIYIANFVDAPNAIGNWLTYIPKTNGPIYVKSTDITLPKDMQPLTFRDFGYVDGNVTRYPDGQYDGDNLDNTLFSGKITYPKTANAFLLYGGKVAGGGLALGTMYDETNDEWCLRLFNAKKETNETNFLEQRFYSDVANVNTLVGEEITLNITVLFMEHDGDGAKNDVKLGVWFNEQLYNNTYIYLDNYADATYSMGTYLSFNVGNTSVDIKSVGEINWKPMPEGMTEITFHDFGYMDGNVTGYPDKQYDGDTLDNTLFSGKITFPKTENIFLMYGGKISMGGFCFGTMQDTNTGEWSLRLFDSNADRSGQKFTEIRFYSEVAGVPLVGEELELSFSLQYIDHNKDGIQNDIKLGVWFGGKLYNNNYIYLDNFVDTGHSMGTHLSFYVGKQSLDIRSVGEINWEPMPEGLTELTFRDFGYEDGDLPGNSAGECAVETMNDTLFIGKITFPKAIGVSLLYGGKKDFGGFGFGTMQNASTGEWYLKFITNSGDNSDFKFNGESVFYSEEAGMPLVGEAVDLSISLQYVDHDQDGIQDDVKLGVWFGGKLYCNRYIYMDNYVDTELSIGAWMSYYSMDSSISANVKSVTLNQTTTNNKTLEKIEILKMPEKTSYNLGDTELDIAGGRIALYYNNNTMAIRRLGHAMITGFNTDSSGKKELLVTYQGKTTSFTIVVEGIIGDVSGDGIINGKDVVLLMQYLSNWDVKIDLNASDVNVDGIVDGKDTVLLMQYLAEWDVMLG